MLMKISSIDFGILNISKVNPAEDNLDVVSQPQKVCIARFGCVSSSLSNCLDFLIPTTVLMGLEYKCIGVVM